MSEEEKVKFAHIWHAWKMEPANAVIPGVKSLAQVQNRAVTAFEHIIETNQGQQALVATHDVIVRVLVAHCLGVSNSIYRHLEVANASLTIIQLVDGGFRLRLLNDTGHLEGNLQL